MKTNGPYINHLPSSFEKPCFFRYINNKVKFTILKALPVGGVQKSWREAIDQGLWYDSLQYEEPLVQFYGLLVLWDDAGKKHVTFVSCGKFS